EMVPRSNATLLSYESERKTVGELVRKTPKKKRTKTYNYFAEKGKRFPFPRLTFSMKGGKPSNMNHLALLYPSVSLANLFNPIDVLNRELSLQEIKAEIKAALLKLLQTVSYKPKEDNGR